MASTEDAQNKFIFLCENLSRKGGDRFVNINFMWPLKSYNLARAAANFEDAEIVCGNEAHVATVHSIYEQTFIAHEIRDENVAMDNWIGIKVAITITVGVP